MHLFGYSDPTASEARYIGYKKTVSRLGATLLIFLLLFFGLDEVLAPIRRLLFDLLDGRTYAVAIELYDMVRYLASFMLPVLFCHWITPKQERTPMPLGPVAPRRMARIVPAAIAMIYSAVLINAFLVRVMGLEGDYVTAMPMPDSSMRPHTVILVYMATSLVPAFCEEFLFRGLILSRLMPYGKTVAVIGSAVLFGVMHQTIDQIFYATVAGVILALVTIKSGSIWGAVIVHMFQNLFSVIDTVLWNRFPYEAEMILYSVIEVIVLGSGVLCLVCLMLRRDKEKTESDALRAGMPLQSGAIRGFCTPTMLAFFVLSALQMALWAWINL